MDKIADIKDHLTQSIAQFDAILKRHSENFQHNPYHALEFSDAAFRAAARRAVYRSILKYISEHSESIDDVKDYVVTRALHGASNQSRSTSTCEDLIHRESVAAWADFVQVLNTYD